MTTHNPQPQPQVVQPQPQVAQPQPTEQQPMEQQPMEQTSEMEQGGEVAQQQVQEDPDKLVLDWGIIFTFFK